MAAVKPLGRSVEAVLTTADVASLLGVKAATIRHYRADSLPGGRYAEHPFPKPDGKIGPLAYWNLGRERELLDWSAMRAGKGAGGGRPAHGSPARRVNEELAHIPKDRGNVAQQALRSAYNMARRADLAADPDTPPRASLERALRGIAGQFPNAEAGVTLDREFFGLDQ